MKTSIDFLFCNVVSAVIITVCPFRADKLCFIIQTMYSQFYIYTYIYLYIHTYNTHMAEYLHGFFMSYLPAQYTRQPQLSSSPKSTSGVIFNFRLFTVTSICPALSGTFYSILTARCNHRPQPQPIARAVTVCQKYNFCQKKNSPLLQKLFLYFSFYF